MSIAKCYSAHLAGLSAEIITVEVDISHGLHALSIVGLGDRAVEEAKDRICAAIKNSGYTSPKQKNQKVVISLAPADIRKEGPVFDLAMAISYLRATGDVEFDGSTSIFLGELSLEGNIRKVSGVLPILCELKRHGFSRAFIPRENSKEASLTEGLTIYAISSLKEVTSFLKGESKLEPIDQSTPESGPSQNEEDEMDFESSDMRWIRGNETAKRGLEIAAAGGHNILMYGPPGTGKTMLAQSFPSILPPLTKEEAIEVTSIHSAARALDSGFMSRAPFRAPHHTASYSAVIGGGSVPRPGEITLAHRGVLFMDELPEFDRTVLEALREPLESRSITISRTRGAITFPAHCILIASMNPCPCGKPREHGCICTAGILSKYRRRISGPILDRIDMLVNVRKVDYKKLSAHTADGEASSIIRGRVTGARQIQRDRFKKFSLRKKLNSEMSSKDIEICVTIEPQAREMLADIARKMQVSGRSFHRIIKVAQTIADIENSPMIYRQHILEALQYRQKIE